MPAVVFRGPGHGPPPLLNIQFGFIMACEGARVRPEGALGVDPLKSEMPDTGGLTHRAVRTDVRSPWTAPASWRRCGAPLRCSSPEARG